MDDATEATPRRRGGRSKKAAAAPAPVVRDSKPKYMEQLQQVANRERTSVTIELEDLQEVCQTPFAPLPVFNGGRSTKITAPSR